MHVHMYMCTVHVYMCVCTMHTVHTDSVQVPTQRGPVQQAVILLSVHLINVSTHTYIHCAS